MDTSNIKSNDAVPAALIERHMNTLEKLRTCLVGNITSRTSDQECNDRDAKTLEFLNSIDFAPLKANPLHMQSEIELITALFQKIMHREAQYLVNQGMQQVIEQLDTLIV